MPPAVKYRAVLMQGKILLEMYVPLEAAALTAEEVSELQTTFAAATTLVSQDRDRLAAQITRRGVCPWCNDLLGHADTELCDGAP